MAKDNPDPGGADVCPPSDLKSPLEHAQDMKAVKTVVRTARVNGEPETFELFHWQHAAAEALHGWKQHAHHEAAPIRLSRNDYDNALRAASHPVTRAVDKDGKAFGDPIDSHEAAAKGITARTDYEPHAPALSIHYGKAV